MISPFLQYDKLKNISNIEELSFQRLFMNYLVHNLRGEQKLIDIDSTDQETIIKEKKSGIPIPGMIYTFIHMNEKNLAEIENFKTGKVITFHDFTPILFCTSFNIPQRLIKGLNLNILPPLERLKFLQAFWEYYKDFFKNIEEKTENNELAINFNYYAASFIGKNPTLFAEFNRSQNAYFEYAYRSYNLYSIDLFRMIEYQEWQFIPFFNAKLSIKRANLDNIYRIYKDNKKFLR